MSLVTPTDNLPRLADPVAAALEAVEFDLYRDVHKGLRAELLSLPVIIGRTDHSDPDAIEAVTGRLHGFLDLLDDHAEHEEEHLTALIADRDPALASRVEVEHRIVERTMGTLRRLGDDVVTADEARRRIGLHRLYLASASFVSEYLAHLSTEEVEIMPLLAMTTPVDELLAVNNAIVSAVPPDQMDRYLGHMVPAQNPIDRVEMYAGMRGEAPSEVFAHLLGVADGALDRPAADRLRRELDQLP